MAVYTSLSDFKAGWEGDITRHDQMQIVPAFFKDSTEIKVGKAVYFNADGKLDYLTDPDANTLAGFIVRTYPAGSGYPASTDIMQGSAIGLMKRGYMLVKCVNGDPKQGGKVHIYKTDNGSKKQGEFAAAEDSGFTAVLPGVYFAATGTQNGLAEITFG